ncbi:hypothetical protein ABZ345_30805 [Lentzea sp. NPDC005914]|uniref:hypothetical protein n=1 Tax=Lentzea sp. NPDC005914 TaxID=3154572 RepID=UPI0033C34D7E
MSVERWTGKYPADDDNVWFVTRSAEVAEVQIDTADRGHLPFRVETEDDVVAELIELPEAIAHVLQLLEEPS